MNDGNEMSLAALLGAATWFGGKRRREKPAEERRAPESADAAPAECGHPDFIWAPNPLFQ
ncbi:MAG: hypothetical protein J0H94_04195 [Rhizobiales bacterium]|jgi:hypothetical protein|nr:hypothetical protein [Hyphomicrobiales bacterium]